MAARKRDAWLDSVRGVAVLLVLGRHIELPVDAPALLVAWQRGGWVGVDLFFVLSGFLVAGLLFREYQRYRTLAVPRFLARRAWRIYPPFFVMLLCTALVASATGIPRISPRAFLAELFFVQNYRRGVWNHTWSLAVEEHFYLVLPLVLLGLAARGRGKADPFRAVVPIGVAAIVAAALLRGVNAWRHPYAHPTHLFPSHLRADALAAGVLLAYAACFHRDALDRLVRPRRRALLASGIACFVPAFVFELGAGPLLPTLGLSLFALGSVAVIAAGAGTAVAPLAALGRGSYAIYLWHMPVLVWGLPLCDAALGYRLDGLARIAVYLAGSVLVGAAMAAIVERPMLWLRDRGLPADRERVADPPVRRCA